MTAAEPSRLTDQRLQRLSLWLALTVAWFAAHVMAQIAPNATARMLKRHAETARMLLVLRAVRRTVYRAPRPGPMPIELRRHTTRRVAGAALRRALRQSPRALCAILAAPERWIAHVKRRLRRGMTKLRRLPKVRRCALLRQQMRLCHRCAPPTHRKTRQDSLPLAGRARVGGRPERNATLRVADTVSRFLQAPHP